MTIKEEAQEIINKYKELGKDFTRGVSMEDFAKECAILHVDGILKALKEYDNRTEEFLKGYFGERYFTIEHQEMAILVFRKKQIFEHWEKVKKEIELL